MATRSTIAVQHKDNTISVIYCHWDGYISHNGKLLVDYYPTLELAEELVSFGDMSVLGKKIHPTAEHTFDNPEENVTVYYGRDRGETDVDPLYCKDIKEYKAMKCFEEYNYIFRKNDWYLYSNGRYNLVRLLKEYKKSHS